MPTYIIVETMFNCCHSDGETTQKNPKNYKTKEINFMIKSSLMTYLK